MNCPCHVDTCRVCSQQKKSSEMFRRNTCLRCINIYSTFWIFGTNRIPMWGTKSTIFQSIILPEVVSFGLRPWWKISNLKGEFEYRDDSISSTFWKFRSFSIETQWTNSIMFQLHRPLHVNLDWDLNGRNQASSYGEKSLRI